MTEAVREISEACNPLRWRTHLNITIQGKQEYFRHLHLRKPDGRLVAYSGSQMSTTGFRVQP